MSVILPSTYPQPVAREQVFIPATSFALPTGTSAPSLALTGSRFPGWQMQSAVDGTIRATWLAPFGWSLANVDLLWVNTVASAGNVRWGSTWAYMLPGATIAADTGAEALLTQAALGQNLLTVARMWSARDVGSRQIHHMRVTRYGSLAADTLTNAAGLLGVRITRVA